MRRSVPVCSHCGAAIARGTVQCPRCGVTWSGGEEATLPGPGHHVDPHAADAMIGRSIIGQFVVRQKLGDGGMGAVYVADQPDIGRTVVIKVIHPWLSKDPQIAERFAAEARAAARLHGPHIVAIHNYGRLPDGTLFLAMEHLLGSTLAQLLSKSGRMDATRAVAITRQVCEALNEAHRKGVVHRDLKPSNIMILPRAHGPGFAKVLDFGVARIDGRDVSKAPVGTLAYMAPEQLAGGPVDGRSDLYSLAVVLYEMLTGRTPFSARTAADMKRLHETAPIAAPSAVAPGIWIPHAVEACVMRALAREPHARPQSADQFADELYNAVMATVADSAMIKVPIPRAPLPSRTIVLAAVLGGIAIVGIGSVLAWRSLRATDVTTTLAVVPIPTPPPEPPPADAREPTVDASKRALLEIPIERLQAELQRVAVLRGLPAQAVAEAIAKERAAKIPADVDPETELRMRMADLILTWQALPEPSDPSDRSQDELEAVFLTMDSEIVPAQRRRMINELKTRVDQGAPVRQQLVLWIRDHGGAYMHAVDGEVLVIEPED